MKHVVGAVLLAGGTDQQLPGGVDLAFLSAGMYPVLARCLMALEACPEIQSVAVVVRPERMETARAVARRYGGGKLAALAPAGAGRAVCLAAGLAALPAEADLVVVHETARPAVRPGDLSAVIQAASRGKGGAASACRVPGGVRSRPGKGPARRVKAEGGLWLTACPHACERAALERGLQKLRKTRGTLADETELMDLAGLPVHLVESARAHLRVQGPDDLALVAHLAD